MQAHCKCSHMTSTKTELTMNNTTEENKTLKKSLKPESNTEKTNKGISVCFQ